MTLRTDVYFAAIAEMKAIWPAYSGTLTAITMPT